MRRDPRDPQKNGPRAGGALDVHAPEVDVPELDLEVDLDLEPSTVQEIDVSLDLPPARVPEVQVDVTPVDVTPGDVSPPEVTPPAVEACEVREGGAAISIEELRREIADERQKSLRERADHDADQSFPASDPPARY